MEFDRCVTFSRRSTTALPTCNQLIWQCDGTAVFEYNRFKSVHQLQRHFPIRLHHDAGHLLQNGMQELGTRLGEALGAGRTVPPSPPRRGTQCNASRAASGMLSQAKTSVWSRSAPLNFLCRSIQPVSRARTFARSSIMCFREHSTCDRLVMALLLLEMISEMLFQISSQMELLFASS